MDDNLRNQLDSQDWELIIKKATIHAIYQFKFWNLISEKNLKGYSPDSIVMEAIEKVYNDEWKWDPEKSNLLTYLKYHVINGLIANLVKSKELSVSSNSDITNINTAAPGSIDKNIESEEIFEIIKNYLREDEIVLKLFEGLYDGLKRREICKYNKWSNSVYDAALKRMATIFKKKNVTELINMS